jgi:NAD(P)-dependent dehydrogenase (short-subunit alcohol dehydrogenase family)
MAKQPRSLNGNVAAITGGARGIGRATARAFVREGIRVAIGDVDVAAARATAEEIGAGTIGLELDVTDRASFEKFVDEVESQLGPLDVLVNNAGIMLLGRFVDEDDQTAQRMIDINLNGVILGSKIALNRFLPRGHGHLVNIASQAGKLGTPGGATYAATKHAVVGLSEAIRGELRLMGVADIDVSYVMPAIVNTELGSGLVQARGVKTLTPEEVAEAIVDALRHGTVDVWVPKNVKGITQFSMVLPRPATEAIGRAFKADRVLWGADMGVRRDYELRAANSGPALEPGTDHSQLTEVAGSDVDERV